MFSPFIITIIFIIIFFCLFVVDYLLSRAGFVVAAFG